VGTLKMINKQHNKAPRLITAMIESDTLHSVPRRKLPVLRGDIGFSKGNVL
jgi:hypothetical protein